MKDGYCENCLNPAECYMSWQCWPSNASTNPDAKIDVNDEPDPMGDMIRKIIPNYNPTRYGYSESKREAAVSADEKPDGQAENASMEAREKQS